MSIEHLKKLKICLEENAWVVAEEIEGNDYDVSGYWRVTRPNGGSEFCLAFEGLDDLETLSIEKTYACHVVGNKEIGLYFGKVSKSFPKELEKFIGALSRVDT